MPKTTVRLDKELADRLARSAKAHAARDAKKLAAAEKKAVSRTKKTMMAWVMVTLIVAGAGLWTYSLVKERLATVDSMRTMSNQIPKGQVKQALKGAPVENLFVPVPETMSPTAVDQDPVDRIFDRVDRIVGSLAGILGMLMLMKQLMDRKKEKEAAK